MYALWEVENKIYCETGVTGRDDEEKMIYDKTSIETCAERLAERRMPARRRHRRFS